MQVAKRLITGSQLTASAATYYTAPANTKTVIKRLTFCNTSTAARIVTLYLVGSGGTAGDANTITKTKTLFPGETWSCPDAEGHVIETGGTIQAMNDSTTTSVTIMASGVEMS